MRIVCASFLLFFAWILPAADLPLSRHAFVVIAHRANHTRAHENTLAAIEAAIKADIDYVELDVRRTADGEYVLMHDSTVDRMTDGHGSVSKLTLAQLRALKVRDLNKPQTAPDQIPTFKEALSVIKGRINLYLDFKSGDRVTVAKLIRDAGVSKQVLVYDEPDSVQEWHRVAPELPLIVSTPRAVTTPEQVREFVTKFGVEVLDGDWTAYTPQLVEAAKLAGARVWPDIQDHKEDRVYFAKVTAVGFTGVQTDHPELLVAWLSEQHRR